MFCNKCGASISDDSQFCNSCGSRIDGQSPVRKTNYDGEIKKCPNCGSIINSFELTCSECGYELRGTKSSGSISELAKKLEEVEKNRRKSNGFGATIARAISGQTIDDVDQAKVDIIQNFPIPTNKEDIWEFLILSSSNMKSLPDATDGQKAVAAAWKAKFEQAYQKAKITFGTSADFDRIQALYDEKIGNAKKLRKKVGIIALIACSVLAVVIALSIIIGVAMQEPPDPNSISVGLSSSEIVGMNYTSVVQLLENQGFTNIELVEKDDLIIGLLTRENSVESISINGDDYFGKNDRFMPYDKIIIVYHSFAD